MCDTCLHKWRDEICRIVLKVYNIISKREILNIVPEEVGNDPFVVEIFPLSCHFIIGAEAMIFLNYVLSEVRGSAPYVYVVLSGDTGLVRSHVPNNFGSLINSHLRGQDPPLSDWRFPSAPNWPL